MAVRLALILILVLPSRMLLGAYAPPHGKSKQKHHLPLRKKLQSHTVRSRRELLLLIALAAKSALHTSATRQFPHPTELADVAEAPSPIFSPNQLYLQMSLQL
jgi:hypothetical protein